MLKEQPSSLIYALYAGDGLGRPATDVFTTADKGFSGPTALTLNTWIHLAATYDGTTQRLYVNGVQVATKAITGADQGLDRRAAHRRRQHAGTTSGSPA